MQGDFLGPRYQADSSVGKLHLRMKELGKLFSYHRFVFRRIPSQSFLAVVLKRTVLKLDQPNAMLRENVSAPLIIESSLPSAMATATR